MDAKTRKVIEAHTAELATVVRALRRHTQVVKNLESGLNILNTTLKRTEKAIQELPCNRGNPCNDDAETTKPEVPRARRLKLAGRGA